MLSRFLLALLVGSAPVAAQSSGATERPVTTGSYTEDQAARGETAFKMYCASCHTPDYHTGEQFRMNWFGRSAYDLFKVLKTTMPEDNVGGLTDDEYTRVIAYILKLNGFAAGADSLRSDSLELQRIRIGPAGKDSVQQERR